MTEERDAIWRQLELPEPAPAPPGFGGRVLARARAERAAASGRFLASGPARLAAAAVMVAGIAGGVLLASWSESAPSVESPFAWSDSSLAELYVAGAGGSSQ